MSLHADVAVPARDRKRLERLCRYVARPPLALDRLEAMPDGRLAYRLKTPWRDGTTHVLMERHELLERLAPLIPPPRAHQVRYHGVLAPCASGRDRVVPGRTRRDDPEPVLRAIEAGLSQMAAQPTTPRLGANNGLDARPGHEPETIPPCPTAWIDRTRPSLDQTDRGNWAEIDKRCGPQGPGIASCFARPTFRTLRGR
jgi:hypothetical protein